MMKKLTAEWLERQLTPEIGKKAVFRVYGGKWRIAYSNPLILGCITADQKVRS